MKIKDILRTLMADDASDHAGVGDQMDVWQHGNNCVFCRAARMAQVLIDSVALRDMFEPGNEVAIGDVTGIVESVDIVYTVRLTGADGKRRYIKINDEYVSAPPTASPADEYFSDRDGDIWKVSKPGMLVLYEHAGTPTPAKSHKDCNQGDVEKIYGPLVPVKR